MKRIDPRILEALDGTSYRIVRGGRHLKIIISGRLAGIMPYGRASDGSQRGTKNIIAQIRRVKQTTQKEDSNGYRR